MPFSREAAGGGGEILYFMSPGRALAAKSMLPAIAPQIYGSAQIASAAMLAVAVGAFVSAFGPTLQIVESREATLHFEDTTPLPIVTPGSPPTVAAPPRELFQADFDRLCGWNLRILGAAQWIQSGMTW
jgi:hypothetical protein